MDPIQVLGTLLMLFLACKVAMATKEDFFLNCSIPGNLELKLQTDSMSIKMASTDYGNMVHVAPSAVFSPSSVEDIRALIWSSYNCASPFVISVRGNGHSLEGQAMASNGVVVDMQQLRETRQNLGVSVSQDLSFADVGGEVLWSDVLNQTLVKGVLPISWTDFLGLTVGGTLSNAGISGQTFRFGPQINNVLEMDVVTGRGHLVTCSASKNSKLFYSVMGGLGQFGVITRARIPLQPAKHRVLWLRALYSNFDDFTNDQESIIAINGKNQGDAVGYLEGEILLDNGTPNDWSTYFFSSKDRPKVLSLVQNHGIIYCIEIAEPYDRTTKTSAIGKMEGLANRLNPIRGMIFEVDTEYTDFLNRVQVQKVETESHPWLNLFVPKSRISDFNSAVIKNILFQRRNAFGPILLYPINKSKWDARMSTTTPDEDVFYAAGFLLTSNRSDWRAYRAQNEEILKFCKDSGIQFKTYLHRYSDKQQWVEHFGSKWTTFERMKTEFDPKRLLSPEQNIFN